MSKSLSCSSLSSISEQWSRSSTLISILRLTKQYEGGMIKCGNYWEDQTYGSLLVHLDSQTGGEDERPAEISGFNFFPTEKTFDKASRPGSDGEVENIHRTFTLSKKSGDSRKVVQVQCTLWPDFDVPESPDVLLNLLRDVNNATAEARVGQDATANQPPILVHCESPLFVASLVWKKLTRRQALLA